MKVSKSKLGRIVLAIALPFLALFLLGWTAGRMTSGAEIKVIYSPEVTATPEPRCYGAGDFAAINRSFSCTSTDACYDQSVDYDASGRVDVADYNTLHRRYGQCFGPALPWLRTQSGRIVRVDNSQPVELRGVNLLRSEWVYPSMQFELQAFPVLSSTWHANLIVHGFASAPVAAGDAQYLGILDQYQALAEANHQYIIFAYYYPDLNGDQPPYPGVDPNWEAALVALVQRYRDKSNVMFILQAEPHSDWWPSYPNGESYRVTWNCTSGSGYDHYAALRPIYDQAITALRAVDNASPYKHLILASGDGYGRDISPVVTDEYGCNGGNPDPLTADGAENVVYSSHPYDPPSEWSYFLPVADAGYPVLVTEFGTGGQMSESDTETLVDTLNSGDRHISWTSWIFDSEGCPCLLASRSTFAPTSPYGAFIRDTIQQQATRFP